MNKNEKNVIRLTNQLTATITLANISRQEFFNDIIDIKNKTITSNQFITKYPNLFNGNTANFGKTYYINPKYKSLSISEKQDKSVNSFLASVRRNSNPNQYNQVKQVQYQDFNQELRNATIHKAKIQKKISKAKHKTHSRSTIFSKKNKYYKSNIGYLGFAEKQVLNLKQVWQIDFIIKNKINGRQEVLLRINYDLYTEKGKLFDSNLWITFSSGFSMRMDLIQLYYSAYKQYTDFLVKVQASHLVIVLKRVCTYVIRKGGL